MTKCPMCSNLFDEWYSRNKGKPQKFPYKRCFNCKLQLSQDNAPEYSGTPQREGVSNKVEYLGDSSSNERFDKL